jgi:hydroxypyruvate reductase
VERIAGKNVAVLSAGTDGIDGNSPAAGAVADGETLARARAVGLDPPDAFRRSDAHTFFARLEDAILTGPTGNNLRDLRILIAEPNPSELMPPKTQRDPDQGRAPLSKKN